VKLLHILLLLLTPTLLVAQYQLKGKVVDSKSKTPLAFVNIIANNENYGTTTGIDGDFLLTSKNPISTIKLSYVGYEPLEINVSGQQFVTIKLNPTKYQLDEVKVLPGINPAERIINEVIKNRKKNNPEKSLNFKYESYNKMYFTGQVDSSLMNNPEKIAKLDTNDQEAIEWLEKHHLFMMESVTERKYKLPDKSYEKVIASRVSGLKNPTFSLLGTELQSFSFYNPTLNVLGNAYLNPITRNSVNKYLFLIEDTTYNGADTVYIISFRPRKGKHFDGLKGLLYINTGGFALQNVIAEPAKQDESIIIKIQQQYKKIDGSWFPVELNSNMIFNNAQVNNFKMMGIGKTYLKNIQINPEITNKEFSYIETEIDIDATKKDEEFWDKYRGDTLSQKEKNTYHVIDSIGKAEHFDRKLVGLEALMTGKLKWGYISFDLNRFAAYNDYEGFRLGAGLHTNKSFSKWFSIGGYGAYAFKDKTEKYGGDIDFLINYKNDVSLNFAYQKDVAEPGVVHFYDYKVALLSTAGNREFYLGRKNNIEKIEARLKFRTLRYLKIYAFANQEKVNITNDYYFTKTVDGFTTLYDNNYIFNEIGVEFRYAYKEKVVQTLSMKYAKPSKYPTIYAKIERGVTALDGEYDYTRLTVRTEKKFRIKDIGRPSFYAEAGLTNGKVPQHKLNSSLGTNMPNAFLISTENAFETMLPYEFFSDKYVTVHFRHSFGKLLLKIKKFEPEFVITTSAGFGSLANKELHQGTSFKTMEKGYFESGLVVNNVLKLNFTTFGLGVFYRYGPYAFEKESENLLIKMSLGYAF
jgi:hypothetical protein